MANIDFDELKKKVDIVKVISSYIDVVKKGSNYAAVCPFHSDTNPSLMISPSKQIFNCFVCHTGGDAFNFVKKYEKNSYIEAVKKACEICGVESNISVADHSIGADANKETFLVLEDLAKFYQFYIETSEGKIALDYLNKRGIDLETIHQFRIGFAPRDNTLSIEAMRNKKSHSIDALTSGGILIENSSNFIDRFSNRIMFPISDQYGRVVGFSGRLLDGSDQAKYVNSPETILFKKNEILYNFSLVKESAKKLGYIYIVEGFMDAIALERGGLPAVALMGTALTTNHVEMLKNLKCEVRLCLDSDAAGQLNTNKCALLLTKMGVRFKVVKPLLIYKDPDELLQNVGKQVLIESMSDLEEPLIHLAEYLKKGNSLQTYEQKENFLNTYRALFLALGNLERIEVLPKVAKTMNLDLDTLKALLNSRYQDQKSRAISSSKNYHTFAYDMIEVLRGIEDINNMSRLQLIKEINMINCLRSSRELESFFNQNQELFLISSFTLLGLYINDYYLNHLSASSIDLAGLMEMKTKMMEEKKAERLVPLVDVLAVYSKDIDMVAMSLPEFESLLKELRDERAKLKIQKEFSRSSDEEEQKDVFLRSADHYRELRNKKKKGV